MTESLVIMGVAGCGKSSLGAAVAHATGLSLVEGDDFHSPASRAKMSQGIALTDADRDGWLSVLGEQLRAHPQGLVLTCSALKLAYRARLRQAAPGLRFVFLDISREESQARVSARAQQHFFSTTLVGITQEMALWDTPFLISNTKEADALLDGPVGDKIKDKLQEKGLVGLVYWENGFRNLTNSKRPVTKVEDMDGIKLRVMQNNVFLNSFKTLGANAIPMAFSELFGALETKTVDGQENPYNTILSSKFYEVQKYLTVTNHIYSPWILLVSKKWWDTLSKAEQKVLTDAAKTSRDFERKDTREEASKAMADLKAKGMLVNELSPAEADRMRAKLTGVYADIGKEVGMDLWNETQKELARIRSAK